MTLIYAYQNRNLTKDIEMIDVDGEVIVAGSGDILRAIIGHEAALQDDLSGAKLVVTSAASTANGSSFSKNTPSNGVNRLRLDAQDLSFDAGVYTLLIEFNDGNDAADWKTVSRQVMCLEDT